MNIEIVTDSSYARRVVVTIPASQVGGELDKAYADLKRKVRLHGFRPGKAPQKVLEAQFGPKIAEDVAGRLIQLGWMSAMQDHGLDPVGPPSVAERGDVIRAADFNFTIAVEVKPSVSLTAYTGLDVVYPRFEVSDEEIDNAVTRQTEAASKLVAVEDRPVGDNDMVQVELTITDGDAEVLKEPGTMIRTAGDTYLPGIEAFLSGMALDEEKSGEVTFGEKARTQAVAGRTLQVSAKVLGIQTNQVPELTDDVAEELGFEGGVEGMRLAVRARLEEGREELARNQARANLLQVLIEANPFDVPGSMVEENLKRLIEELKLQQAYRGVDPRTVTFGPAQIADLRNRAAFATKAALILETVWTTETIEVTDADIDGKLQELADQRGQTIEAVRGYFTRENALDELRERLLEEKTLDWLLERANPVEASAAEEPAAEEAAAEEAPASEE